MAAWPLGQGENSVIGEPGRRLEGDTNTRLSIYCARVTGGSILHQRDSFCIRFTRSVLHHLR